MIGHHIYTSSYFKYGSNSKNPGTYTVELTQDIFGTDTDEVIFKLNQMCASVPETLTPRNTNESILRLYHILPDTTIISRSWFVTDEITNRGTVPYSHSLIFRGRDNEKFLKNPAKSFDINSTEHYKSYLERVNTDSPTKLSTKYDPKSEDYNEPFIFSKNDWITEFGLDSDLFAKYYISLGRAVCGKGNSHVAVILNKNMDGEKFILATLSLLPQFMKRKFAAVSKWTGMMDGSGSTAVNGIHLLCYYDESPMSESGFPVVDLTGEGRHANIAAPTGPESGYAAWIWQNIDDRAKLSEYDEFIEINFSSVLNKIPFEVIANTFVLWRNKNIEHCDNKVLTLMTLLIAGSFAKNFSKFDFISSTLERITDRLLNKVEISAYDDKTVQAVCVLAANGSAGAKKLVSALFTELKDQECWDRLVIVLQYYKSFFETTHIGDSERLTALSSLWACISLGSKSRECAEIAHEPLIAYCRKLRETILADRENSETAFLNYTKLIVDLKKAFELTDSFFQLRELGKDHSIDAERFFELEKFDIETLGYVPTIQHWIQAIDYTANLTVKHRSELWLLYYSKVRESREEYLSALEKEKKAIVGEQNQVLVELCESDEVTGEIIQYYREKFDTVWNGTSHSLDSDETWKYVNEWLERLHRVPPIEEILLPYICEKIGLTRDNIIPLAECLSGKSFETAAKLYKDDNLLYPTLESITKIDGTAGFQGNVFNSDINIYNDMYNVSKKTLFINRLKYWYNKFPEPPLEWAVEIALSIGGSGSAFISQYLDLRVSKTGLSSGKAEAIELFKLVNILHSDNKISNLNSLKYRLESIDKKYFKDYDVQLRFSSIKDPKVKNDIGYFIYNILDNDKSVPDDIKSFYSPHNRKRNVVAENDGPILDNFTLGLLTVFLILFAGVAEFILFYFCEGAAGIAEVMGKGFAVVFPYAMSGLILITTVISAISLLRNGGNES